jgi:hypothetical protein
MFFVHDQENDIYEYPTVDKALESIATSMKNNSTDFDYFTLIEGKRLILEGQPPVRLAKRQPKEKPVKKTAPKKTAPKKTARK